MELLRFATVGSVDDGKSTLIGRLLYDSKQIFEDQWDAIELTSKNRGDEYVNLALLTDGLRAEREQGITIDVAYRYFATPRRKFIIADTPGHIQYTRNMFTGASTANLVLILVDARNGIVEQSRRHSYIASLLRIPHMVVCVNKMDLVDWDHARYLEIVEEFRAFARGLDIPDVTFVPISALQGDNVVERSARTPWYEGPALLEHLETVTITSDRNLEDARFPVQYVIRPMSERHPDYRGYAGSVAGGVFQPGDAVTVLPSGLTTRIASIDTFEGPIERAFPPMAVTLTLEDDIDISRGDMIVGGGHPVVAMQEFEAMVCWTSERAKLVPRGRLGIKHTTNSARAVVDSIAYRVNVNTMACEPLEEESAGLALNEIGRVTLRTTAPLFADPYARCRATGSFILVDEQTNNTVGGGMILAPGAADAAPLM